jgi:acetyltransferase-like isoleucine patch superfamily enzyme
MKKLIHSLIGRILRIRFYVGKNKFHYIGKNVRLPRVITVSGGKNISIDHNSRIANGAILYATNANITIGHNVGMARNVCIVTGNHERRVGTFYTDITEATKNHNIGLDLSVTIDSDVWIGINVTILMGVHIGRGTTIGACSVVTRDVPPYSIVAGNPAKFIKFYWTIDQIIEHEAKLYPENERFKREELENYFKKYINANK